MKCSKCGQDLADGVAFCPSCGERVIPTQQLEKCAACGCDIPEGTKFCVKCGAPAVVQDLKCRKCGADIPLNTKFCPNCGTSSINGTTAAAGGTSGTTYSGIMGVKPDDATWQWFVHCIKNKYCDFNGRARRREYWFYVLFSFIAQFVLGLIPIIGWLIGLGLLLPALSAAARRLHDIGKSGLSLLFVLIPLVGPIILIIWLAKEGDRGPNAYGPDPKAV
jgi:Predicted membrane protein